MSRALPILFSGPMVRAILREIASPGTGKTQTRRVLKPRPVIERDLPSEALESYELEDRLGPEIGDGHLVLAKAPRYAVGDRLWVREAWRTLHTFDDLAPRHLADDRSKITYEADPEHRNPLWAFGRLRPGMFLPRWASRITLEVTAVKVERLQSISAEDTDAEIFGGDYPHVVLPHLFPDADKASALTLRECFSVVWSSIHPQQVPIHDEDGKKIGMEPSPARWEANPFVAAYTFRPFLANVDDWREG